MSQDPTAAGLAPSDLPQPIPLPQPLATRAETARLAFLFGAIYFVQGFGEPSQGLVAQPVRSLLRSWGQTPSEIASFMAVLSFPWNIKPLFGLISDFVPIRGYRRKSYLVITSLITCLGLLGASLAPLSAGAVHLLLALLALPTFGIAFSDVVADGLMVEKGQPLGITGRLQSVQWAAMYSAGILTGVLGGYLSEHGLQRTGFAVCGALAVVTFVASLTCVDETRVEARESGRLRAALIALWQTARSRTVLAVGGFLFLLNFNPFSSDVLYLYMTDQLGLSEQFVGTTYSVSSVASIVACLVYGVVGPRIPLRWLIHGSIVTMLLSTLFYWGLTGQRSAMVISVAVGFAYMITTLVQLDLAARFVPTATAGTVFALLMSLSNLSVSMSGVVGGHLFENFTARWGATRAFHVLVAVGAAFTAACWGMVLLLPKEQSPAEPAGTPGT